MNYLIILIILIIMTILFLILLCTGKIENYGERKSAKNLKKLYQGIMKNFENSDIVFVLIYGTLLGKVRENSFIKGDDDVDVLLHRSQRPLLEKIIKQNNIKTGIVKDDIIQLFYGNLGPFDIYMVDNENDDIVQKWSPGIRLKNKDFCPIQKIKYFGYDVYIPNNPQKLLEKQYGKYWKVPQKKKAQALL